MSTPLAGTTGRLAWVAVRAMVAFTLVVGIGYTLLVTAVGQGLLRAQADGSPVHDAAGNVVGSALIGQSFSDADGDPLPQYFQPRPSAAGQGYDGGASSGSNHGPNHADLVTAITERKAQIAAFNGVSQEQVPPDALTASGSGLDPHVSPAYAAIQVDRVAAARTLSPDEVRSLVAAHTQGRTLGYLGEPTVNVVELNLALDTLGG